MKIRYFKNTRLVISMKSIIHYMSKINTSVGTRYILFNIFYKKLL